MGLLLVGEVLTVLRPMGQSDNRHLVGSVPPARARCAVTAGLQGRSTPNAQLSQETLLCFVKGCGGVVFQGSVEVSGYVAFEAAADFAGCFSFVGASGDVGLGALVVACSGQGHDV